MKQRRAASFQAPQKTHQPGQLRALVPEELQRRLSSPAFSRRALLAGFGIVGTAALTGCHANGFAASAPADGALEGTLNIYSWGDYDDPANLEKFGERGVQVQTDSFASNEELIAKLGAARGTSGYDIVVPTSTYLPLLTANGLLQKLELDRIPNIKQLAADFRDTIADPQSSYAVCKNWGTTGFIYDTTVIKRELRSWADFLDAAQQEASKNVSMLDDAGEIAAVYLAAHGHDIRTIDPKLIEACTDYMVNRLAEHLRVFNSTPADLIVQGSMALLQAYNGDARRGLLDSDDPDRWKWVYPTPTSNRWMDTWAIPVGAQHPDSAYAFIDFMLDPEVALKEVDYIGYSTGLNGQQQLAEQAELDLVELLYPPADVVKRMTVLTTNEASESWIDMLGQMQAKAGA
ncbi:spermidine/putrescine ABC transporter substrate-binding protein [Psychromicrobium sp. YIM B11713]|uniref:polyamine ABC transporter substrate-binding protein n=1 Tax=Psychromicrobium sp. YIM B11713 TaxID=3145233 RepID=UPI00374F44F7